MNLSDNLGKNAIFAKAFLFIVLLGTAVIMNVFEQNIWLRLFSIFVIVWCSARIYYFMFYVIEKYIDSEFKFSSIYAAIIYLLKKNER